MYQTEVAIRKYTIYGGKQFRKEIGMTKETLDDIREVIGTLSVCISYKSINNITSIPTYDLLHQVNILKKIVQNKLQINLLIEKARGLHLIIPVPMTVEEFKNNRGMNQDCVLIDEGYNLIGEALDSYLGAHVTAVTLTDKVKEFADKRVVRV